MNPARIRIAVARSLTGRFPRSLYQMGLGSAKIPILSVGPLLYFPPPGQGARLRARLWLNPGALVVCSVACSEPPTPT